MVPWVGGCAILPASLSGASFDWKVMGWASYAPAEEILIYVDDWLGSGPDEPWGSDFMAPHVEVAAERIFRVEGGALRAASILDFRRNQTKFDGARFRRLSLSSTEEWYLLMK
jgi:hypothetical protein